MAVYKREVKNKKEKSGKPTGKKGFVYDVAFRYKDESGKWQPYGKRGFFDEVEALTHQKEMREYFEKSSPSDRSKLGYFTVSEYLDYWFENYAKNAVVVNTQRGYRINIEKHIKPYIGNIVAKNLTQFDLDKLYKKLLENLAGSTVSYVHCTISSAWSTGMNYYECFDTNPAFKIQTNFDTRPVEPLPEPYDTKELKILIDSMKGFGDWEFIVCMGGLYGLRRNEILGMELDHILDAMKSYHVEHQLRPDFSRNDKIVVSQVKKNVSDRVLPITEITIPFFERQLERLDMYKRENPDFVDHGLLVCRADGFPHDARGISGDWKVLLLKLGLRHIRLHDLRHTAATNMHALTGDFYTISGILGHTLRGMGNHIGFIPVQNSTPTYITIKPETKYKMLNKYHKAVLKPKAEKKKSI